MYAGNRDVKMTLRSTSRRWMTRRIDGRIERATWNEGLRVANRVGTTSTMQRTDAQRHADDIRVFRDELARLQAVGVVHLAEDQSQAIRSYHDDLLAQYAREFDIDRDVGAKRLSLGMRMASFLGALALAASVFFLFYRVWGWFSVPSQVVTLVVAALASTVAVFGIRARDSSGYFTKLAAMVAFACFVLNIAMLGQIFNITPSDKAFLPWAAFAFLLAYSCDMRLLLVAGIACAVAFLSARIGTWSGIYWIYFGERPENFFPAAILTLFVPQLVSQKRFAGFAQTYRVLGLIVLLTPVLVLAHWGAGSYLPWETGAIENTYQVLGFVLSALTIAYGVRRHWPEVVNTGVTYFVIFLYTKFYDWWWDWMPKYLFFFVIGLSALLLLFVMRRLRAGGLLDLREKAPA